MFCSYINDIYKNHIHQNLIDDELTIYYYPIREHFLDLYNSCNYIGHGKDKDNKVITYYIQNGKILFKTSNDHDYLYVESDVWNLFFRKYGVYYSEMKKIIGEELCKLCNIKKYNVGIFYSDSKIIPKLKIKFRNLNAL